MVVIVAPGVEAGEPGQPVNPQDGNQAAPQQHHAAAAGPLQAAGAPPPAQAGGGGPAAQGAFDVPMLIEEATNGNLEAVQFMVEQQPELVRMTDGCGQSALMWSCYKGRSNIARFLLSRGAHINEKETRRHRTPLYLAAEFGHAELVDVLLENGADPRNTASRSWTVLGHGVAGWTCLTIATYNDNTSVVKVVLERTAAELLEVRDDHDATALWWAARRGRTGAVQWLLEAGADFNHVTSTDHKSVLAVARERAQVDVICAVETEIRSYLISKARLISRHVSAYYTYGPNVLGPNLIPGYIAARLASALPLPAVYIRGEEPVPVPPLDVPANMASGGGRPSGPERGRSVFTEIVERSESGGPCNEEAPAKGCLSFLGSPSQLRNKPVAVVSPVAPDTNVSQGTGECSHGAVELAIVSEDEIQKRAVVKHMVDGLSFDLFLALRELLVGGAL